MREVVGDCETTGLSWRDGDRVVSLGLVELERGRPTGRWRHWHFNPCGRRSTPDAYRVHGLSERFLSIQQMFEEHAPEIVEFLAGNPFVAHNAGFDVGFINNELTRARRADNHITPGRVIDTLRIARKKHPGGKNGLAALAVRYKIEVDGRKLHNALYDCQVLAEVYRELKSLPQGQLDLMEPGSDHRPIEPVEQARSSIRRGYGVSPAEAAAHAAFVKTLGPSAVWLDYMETGDAET